MYKWLSALFMAVFILGMPRLMHGAPPETLRLVANEWEPYTGENVLNYGLASDVVATALRRAGYEVSLSIVPWSRALKGVEAGSYDGIVAAWHNSNREAHMAYSDAYLTNELVLFKRKKDSFRYSALSDLTGKVIGTVRDYAYGEGFDQADMLTKKPALDLRTNIVRLSNNLIDLFPEDRYVVKHLLNSRYPEYFNEIDFLDKPLSVRKLHMTISRKVADYEIIVADFNRELKEMKAEGLLDELIEKHNLNF